MKAFGTLSICLLLACFVGIGRANPDGPARSIVIESIYEAVPNVQVIDGERVYRVGTRLSFPLGSFVTLRSWLDAERYRSWATAEGIGTSQRVGPGIAVRVFIPMTRTAVRYLRHEVNAHANPDGPVGSLGLEMYRRDTYADSDPGFDLTLPVSRHASLAGGWTRRPRIRAFGLESRMSNRVNDWVMLRLRAYVPLTNVARGYHRDLSSGGRANPDGAVGALVVEPHYALELTDSAQWELGVRVSAAVSRRATVRAGVTMVRMISHLKPDVRWGSPFAFASRSALEVGVSYYVPWSDARDELAHWDGR